MNTLVTGGTGFIGTELVTRLVDRGHRVRILHRSKSSPSHLRHVQADVEMVEGDITDAVTVRDAMTGIDQAFHLAARVQIGGLGEKEKLFDTNVTGTHNVVNAALDEEIDRLVHTSTMAVYPTAEQDGSSDTAFEPVVRPDLLHSSYAVSKYEAELEVYRGIAEGLDARIVNPSLVFGYSPSHGGTMKLVDRIARQSLPGVPPGSTNVVDRRDVVDGLLAAMNNGRPGERYFLGSENLSWKQIITVLAEALGTSPPTLNLPGWVLFGFGAVAEVYGFVSRTSPPMTRAMARSAARNQSYSNEKAIGELGVSFRPFTATADHLARKYQNE